MITRSPAGYRTGGRELSTKPETINEKVALSELLRGDSICITGTGGLQKEIKGSSHEDVNGWYEQTNANILVESNSHNTSTVLRDTDADYVIDRLTVYPPIGGVKREIHPREQLKRVITAANRLIELGVDPKVGCDTPFSVAVGNSSGYQFIVDQKGRAWTPGSYTLGDVAKWTVKPEETTGVPPLKPLPK